MWKLNGYQFWWYRRGLHVAQTALVLTNSLAKKGHTHTHTHYEMDRIKGFGSRVEIIRQPIRGSMAAVTHPMTRAVISAG